MCRSPLIPISALVLATGCGDAENSALVERVPEEEGGAIVAVDLVEVKERLPTTDGGVLRVPYSYEDEDSAILPVARILARGASIYDCG